MQKLEKSLADKKMSNIRTNILILETELFKMLNPKDEKGEDFLPPGNEIPFDFKKTRYENMIYNINVSINDLNNIKGYAEKIYKLNK
tara:strand:+ start:298 stop:558 length:261 start_codon:yes stop_codon:yes gene_type:complete